MTAQSSKLRSFAITAENVAELIPKLARERVITRSEADLLVRQLRAGAENALDVAQQLERA